MTPNHADPHVQLLDDARHAQAVADRSQRRLLVEADEQDATFRGSLEEAAEWGGELVLETSLGHRLRGRVRALASDHLVVDGDHGRAWLRLAAVTLVRTVRGGELRAGGGERSPRPDVRLADALRGLVERRADVEVVFDGGSIARGTVTAAGRDVLTLRDPATGERALVHLARAALVVARAG